MSTARKRNEGLKAMIVRLVGRSNFANDTLTGSP